MDARDTGAADVVHAPQPDPGPGGGRRAGVNGGTLPPVSARERILALNSAIGNRGVAQLLAARRASGPSVVTVQRQIDPTAEVMTPEEMYRSLTSNTMFSEGTGRQREQVVGHGQATRAIVQVVDHDGNRVFVAYGRNQGVPAAEGRRLRARFEAGELTQSELRNLSRLHAEDDAMRQVEQAISSGEIDADRIRGGRLELVVNQEVCPRCAERLQDLARRRTIGRVDAHTFARRHLRSRDPSRRARPRATFDTQTDPRSGRPRVVASGLERRSTVVFEAETGGGGSAFGARRRLAGSARRRRLRATRRRLRRASRAQRASRLATLVATALGIGMSRTTFADAAAAIRRDRRRRPPRRRSSLPLDLNNVEQRSLQVLDRNPSDVDVGQVHAYTAGMLDWVARDYEVGGNGPWNQFYRRRIDSNDPDVLGGELIPWLGAGTAVVDVVPRALRMEPSQGGNQHRIESAMAALDGLQAGRRAQYEAFDESRRTMAAVGSAQLEEVLAGFGVSLDDAVTIAEHLRRQTRVAATWMDALDNARVLVRRVAAVNRDRITETLRRLDEVQS